MLRDFSYADSYTDIHDLPEHLHLEIILHLNSPEGDSWSRREITVFQAM